MKILKKSLFAVIATFAVSAGMAGAAAFKTAAAEQSPPVLFSVTDGVKVGDGVVISGANLNGKVTVEYTPLVGGKTKTLTVNGDSYGTGISFVFPYEEQNGVYKVKVTTASGTSNEITMNTARPLFIDKNEVYAGQTVNIVGRNMLASEYGYGGETDAYAKLAVKLKSEQSEYVLTAQNGGVLVGTKTDQENSATGEEIKYSNAFKTAIKIPEDVITGAYAVSVSSADNYFCELDNGQTLNVVQRKEKSFNSAVFGNVSSIGNDPLNIGAAWAQDFNYQSVYTVTANEKSEQSAKALSNTIAAQIRNLSQSGGVIYFPSGEYYLSGINSIPDKIILVGAGKDKTKIYRVGGGGGSFINSYRYVSGADGTTITDSSDYVGIANLTITESDISTGYPDYYVNFSQGTSTQTDENGVKRVSSKNKFLINVDVDTFKDKTTVESGQRGGVSLNGYKNVVIKDVFMHGGSCFSTEGYSYVTLENMRFIGTYKASTTPALQCKYGFIENCLFDLNYSGHGPSVRSDTYIAYTLTKNTGDRDNPTNDGEALLVEMPSGYHATGLIVGATKNSVTLAYKGTSKKNDGETVSESGVIDENSVPRYNDYAVYILSGKGAGQLRYISGTPTKKDNNGYIYEYNLAAYEKDWDIIPDETSTFTLISPIKNLTAYKYVATDCVGTVCLYGNIFDAVVSDCTLTDTAGILLYESNISLESGRHTPDNGILIQRNTITGVGANYDNGSGKAQGTGGLCIDVQRYTNGIKGIGMANVVVRNNAFTDLLPKVKSEGGYNRTGITIKTDHKKSDSDYRGDLRNVIIENNSLTKAEAGIYAEARITGLTLRNNDISEITEGKEIENYSTDGFSQTATYTLVNGENTIKKDLEIGSELPQETKYDKVFVGWIDDKGNAHTHATFSTPVTLTAKYEIATRFEYMSLSLNGDISLNVGVRISDEVFSDKSTQITATYEGETKILNSGEKNEDCVYVYSFDYAPKDFEKKTLLRLTSGGKTLIERQFCIKDYCDYIAANSSDQTLKTLCANLLTYCKAADNYFNGKNHEITVDEVIAEDLKQYRTATNGVLPEGVVLQRISLIVKSQTTIRLYVAAPDTLAVKVNGNAAQIKTDGNGKYIEITNISAKDLDRAYDITLGENCTIRCSTFSYVYLVLANENGEKLTNVVKALCFYNAAANEYFGG